MGPVGREGTPGTTAKSTVVALRMSMVAMWVSQPVRTGSSPSKITLTRFATLLKGGMSRTA